MLLGTMTIVMLLLSSVSPVSGQFSTFFLHPESLRCADTLTLSNGWKLCFSTWGFVDTALLRMSDVPKPSRLSGAKCQTLFMSGFLESRIMNIAYLKRCARTPVPDCFELFYRLPRPVAGQLVMGSLLMRFGFYALDQADSTFVSVSSAQPSVLIGLWGDSLSVQRAVIRYEKVPECRYFDAIVMQLEYVHQYYTPDEHVRFDVELHSLFAAGNPLDLIDGFGDYDKGTLSVAERPGTAPDRYTLESYPNPFNPSTTIRYSIPRAGHASIKIYDMLGREAASLASGFHAAGVHEIRLDGSGLATGTYIIVLRAGGFLIARKAVLMK
jgi:hypothetical protein